MGLCIKKTRPTSFNDPYSTKKFWTLWVRQHQKLWIDIGLCHPLFFPKQFRSYAYWSELDVSKKDRLFWIEAWSWKLSGVSIYIEKA